jgi:hypothetical protein
VAHHLHSSLITAAKNVAESLVVFALGAPQKNLRLEKALEELGGRLWQGQPTRLQFNILDYHLLSKLRILHARTHADRVVIDGRLVDPEFALTVVHDLVQVLRSTGLAR